MEHIFVKKEREIMIVTTGIMTSIIIIQTGKIGPHPLNITKINPTRRLNMKTRRITNNLFYSRHP